MNEAKHTPELTAAQIERGWRDTFSTNNPFCPCDLKTFTKAARWAEANVRRRPPADLVAALHKARLAMTVSAAFVERGGFNASPLKEAIEVVDAAIANATGAQAGMQKGGE